MVIKKIYGILCRNFLLNKQIIFSEHPVIATSNGRLYKICFMLNNWLFPQSVFICFVWFSELTLVDISLNSIKNSDFVMVKYCSRRQILMWSYGHTHVLKQCMKSQRVLAALLWACLTSALDASDDFSSRPICLTPCEGDFFFHWILGCVAPRASFGT